MVATAEVPKGVAAERLRRHYRRRHVMARVGLYVAAVLAAFICAGPFLWSLVTAFKQNRDLYNPENNPFFFNLAATPDHLLYLLRDTAFLTFVWNTLWVGLLVVAITLVLGLPAAYSLARLDRPWSGSMAIAIFFVYLVPPSLLFLSLSRLVVATGLQDSTWSLVLVYPTITIPVSIWLLIGFLKAIPRDVEEQAMVDGYSRLAAFVRVVLPLAFPGHRGRGGVRLHPHRQRVHLRPGLRLAHHREGRLDRRPHRADPRRRLLLAVAAGGGHPGRGPDRPGVQPVPRPLHLRLHHGRGQGLRRRASHDALGLLR